MAAPTQTVQLSSASTFNRVWRKVQGTIQTGFQFLSEEWQWVDRLKEFKIDWSFREITFPVDLNKGGGVTSMVEGGWEATPSSPGLEEVSVNWIHLNKRFNASLMAQWVSQNNASAALTNQLVFQGQKALQAVAAQFSDYFYGYDTAVVCLTDTDLASGATSATLTLTTAYGDTNVMANPNVSAATYKAFLADKFVVGERVALLASGSDALVTSGAIMTITAVSRANGTITGTFASALGGNYTTNGIRLVKFNSIDPDNTITSSDVNKGLPGLCQQMFATSLHGLTHDNWVAAKTDVTGGRFNGTRLQAARDEVQNRGGGDLNMGIMAQGVDRDMFLQYQVGVRYNSPAGIEIDGSVKSKGTSFVKSRRVPPGTVFLMDKEKSIKKGTLLKKPSKGPNWSDGRKLENQSAMVFQIDWPCFLVSTNRLNTAVFGNLVEA